MDPEYDITLNSGEGERSDVQSPFLNSLGLGENAKTREADCRGRTGAEDEGVVLSSLPDNLGFSMAPSESPRGLSLSFSVTRGAERSAPTDITLPTDEDPDSSPDSTADANTDTVDHHESEVAATVAEDAGPDAELCLTCPECEGDLVLKKRHLGVEGICVWCHTAIVAAESGRDGSVRIFPILGKRATASESVATVGEKISDGTLDSGTPMLVSPVPVEDEGATNSVLNPVGESVSEFGTPGDSDGSAGVGFSSIEIEKSDGFVHQTEEESAQTLIDCAEGRIADESFPSGPPDLDSLYDTGGFVPPTSRAHESSVGFDAASPAWGECPSLGLDAPIRLPSETGADAASCLPQPAVEGFSGPTPWGPPSRPPVVAPSAPKTLARTSPLSEDAPPSALPNGFAPAASDASPTEVPTWEDAFGHATLRETAPVPELEPDFSAGFGSPFGTGSAEPEKQPSPFGGFSAEASPVPMASDSMSTGFAGFLSSPPSTAAGPTRAEATPFGGGLFGGHEDPAPLSWNASKTSADEIPASLEPLSPEPGFASGFDSSFSQPTIDSVNPFGDMEIPTGVSPFSSRMQAPPSPSVLPDLPVSDSRPSLAAPPIPPSTPAQPMMGAAMATHPNVTSLPLGVKPKPKVRKGFVVLMVILLGFASGVALASFVLPVDRYVEVARAFMQSKFAPQPAAPRVPQSQTLPAIPPVATGASLSTDSQP